VPGSLIGLRLYQFFLDLGTPEPQLCLSQNVDAISETKTLLLLTEQSIGESIVAGGLASAAKVAAAADDLAQFTAAPDTIVSGPRVLQVWASKQLVSLRSFRLYRDQVEGSLPRDRARLARTSMRTHSTKLTLTTYTIVWSSHPIRCCSAKAPTRTPAIMRPARTIAYRM